MFAIGSGRISYERKPPRFSLIARRLRRGAAHFPRDVIVEVVTPGDARDKKNKVATGVNPAALATRERKPPRFSLIARRLRRGAAHFPRDVIVEVVTPGDAGDKKKRVPTGVTPAALATWAGDAVRILVV